MILRVSSAHLVAGVFKGRLSLLWTEGGEQSKAPQGKLRCVNKELHKVVSWLFFEYMSEVFRAAVLPLQICSMAENCGVRGKMP